MKYSTISKLAGSMILLLSHVVLFSQTNIAPQAVATHSGGGAGIYGPQNYNDGIISTGTFGWVSGTGGPSMWIQFDWTSMQTFDKVRFYPDQANTRTLTAGDIEYWNGSTWVLSTQFTVAPTTMFNVALNSPVTSTKMRIINMTVTGSQSSNPALNEIMIFEANLSANNASVTAIDSPAVFCEGTHNIVATIQNRGINQIDSVRVYWTFNGILQPTYFHTTVLDTLGGVGSTSAQVLLGTETFTSGVKDTIIVWTSMPNGVADTFNLDDTSTRSVQPSLFGNFTINPSGSGIGNYVKWGDLAKDLSDFGVCGPIHVTVSPGSYTESVTFNEIAGASAINTITIVPDTGGPVELNYSANSLADNFIIRLNGADWISFSDFTFKANGSTYSTILEFANKSSYNSFENILFSGNATSTSTYSRVIFAQSADNNYNRFINNDIVGGYYGIYFYGGGTTSTNTGNEWIGNRFTDAYIYGTYFYYSTDLKFNYNSIRSSRGYTSMYGFMSYYSYKAAEVIGNDINIGGYMALYLGYHEGNATSKPLITNNMLRIGKGIGTYGYGIYCINGGYCRIANNTIVTDHTVNTYYGLYLSGGANSVYNNIFHDRIGISSTSYACMYVSGGFALIESDHNDFYTNRAMGYLNTSYATLAAWQTGTGFDLNSVKVNPAYSNFDTLRSCNDSLDGAGTPLAYVSDDFDHDGRHPTTPDIGADEWVGNKPGAYSAGPDAFVCEGKSAEIGLPVTGGTFMWNTADTTPVITVSGGGVYTVDMTSICGGQHSDTVVVVDVTPTSVFNIVSSYRTGQFNNLSANGLSYMWVLHTSPKDTFYTKDLTHVFPDNGPYNVDLYVYNDCDTIMSSQTWNGHVGMGENDLASMISLMPNPASDVMTIRFSGLEGDVQLEMTNIQGQRVYSAIYNDLRGDASRIIDVSSLNKGMYLLRFITSGEVVTKQIVVN